jgi:pyruvate kinase
MGKYPIESITVMDNIVAEAELHLPTRIPSDYLSSHVGEFILSAKLKGRNDRDGGSFHVPHRCKL